MGKSSGNSVEKPFLLLGEGRRDSLFFEFLCRNSGIDFIQFDDGGGFENYHLKLRGAWSARTGFDVLKGLVIVGDNDPNEGKTFKSIKAQLESVDLAAPERPYLIGRKENSPPVAVLSMPFFGKPELENGALESMLIPVIERKYPIQAACFDVMRDCVGANKWKSASSRDKLRVRCILSCSCESNPMAGVEQWFKASENLVPHDDPTFAPIVGLFSDIPRWFESSTNDWFEWKAGDATTQEKSAKA